MSNDQKIIYETQKKLNEFKYIHITHYVCYTMVKFMSDIILLHVL